MITNFCLPKANMPLLHGGLNFVSSLNTTLDSQTGILRHYVKHKQQVVLIWSRLLIFFSLKSSISTKIYKIWTRNLFLFIVQKSSVLSVSLWFLGFWFFLVKVIWYKYILYWIKIYSNLLETWWFWKSTTEKWTTLSNSLFFVFNRTEN